MQAEENRVKQKSIKKGLLYNGFYQVLTTIAPLITAPYVSRVIGVDGYGFFNKIVSIAYYFFIFAMLGVNTYGNREIAKVRDDRKKRSETFWEIYTLQLTLGLISTILYILFVTFFVHEQKMFYYVIGLYVFSTCTDINWYAFGMEEFKLITIRNTIIKLATIVCLFTLVRSYDDLIIYFFIYVLGVIFGLLPVWPLILKTTDFKRPAFRDVWKHFVPNFILFLPYIAASLYMQIDKVMVGVMVSDAEVGYYNYAENILSIPMGLMTAVSNVMLPRASYLVGKGNDKESHNLFHMTMRYTSILNIAMIFGILAVANVFIPWYLGPEYGYTAELMMLLSPTILLSGIATLIRTQVLIPNGREKQYTISIIWGALVNFVLNFFFIMHFHAVGACITTIIANFIVMLVQILYTRKEFDYIAFVAKLLPYVVSGSAMFVLLYVMKSRLSGMPTIISLIILVLTGVAFYGATVLLLLKYYEKDEYASVLIVRLWGKLGAKKRE